MSGLYPACETSGSFPDPSTTPLTSVFDALAPYAVNSREDQMSAIGLPALVSITRGMLRGYDIAEVIGRAKREQRDEASAALTRALLTIKGNIRCFLDEVQAYYTARFPDVGRPTVACDVACDRVLFWILGITASEHDDIKSSEGRHRLVEDLRSVFAQSPEVALTNFAIRTGGRMQATIDGSLKSALGKLLEGFVLRTLLTVLGFEEVETDEELADGKFMLSNVREQNDARRKGERLPEADATLQVGGTRIIIEFGGAVDKTEVLREKLTRHKSVCASIIITTHEPSKSSNLGQFAAVRARARKTPTFIVGADEPLWVARFCELLTKLSNGAFFSPLPEQATPNDIKALADRVYDVVPSVPKPFTAEMAEFRFEQPQLFADLAA